MFRGVETVEEGRGDGGKLNLSVKLNLSAGLRALCEGLGNDVERQAQVWALGRLSGPAAVWTRGRGGCREVFPSGHAQPFALTLLFSKLSHPRPCSGLSQVTLGVVGGFLVLAGSP